MTLKKLFLSLCMAISLASDASINASAASFRAAAGRFFAQAKQTWNKMPRAIKAPIQLVANHPFKLALGASTASTAHLYSTSQFPEFCDHQRVFGPFPETQVTFVDEANSFPQTIKDEIIRIIRAANYTDAACKIEVTNSTPFPNASISSIKIYDDPTKGPIRFIIRFSPSAALILQGETLEKPFDTLTPKHILAILWHEIEHGNAQDSACSDGLKPEWLAYCRLKTNSKIMALGAFLSTLRYTKNIPHFFIRGLGMGTTALGTGIANVLVLTPLATHIPRLHEKQCDTFACQKACTDDLEHLRELLLAFQANNFHPGDLHPNLTILSTHPSYTERIAQIDAELDRRKLPSDPLA